MKLLNLIFMLCLLVLPFMADVCRAEEWSPPQPAESEDFDWIQLKSGEWLKGRIKSMQQDELEFDSEKLDVHVWDWEDDILAVRSPRLLSMRVGDDVVMSGSLLVTASEVQITNINGTQKFPRSNLLSITPAGSNMLTRWTLDLSVGIDTTSGNTSEFTGNANTTLRRLTPATRQRLEFLGNYGKLEDEVTTDDQRWQFYADFLLTRRFFIRAPDAEYFHDSRQNLDYRLSTGGSAGYDLIRTSRTEWEVTAGGAFQRNVYGSVEAGTDEIAESGAVVLGSKYETEVTKRLDLTIEYRGQLAASADTSNLQHTMCMLEYEIHKRLTLDLTYIWDYTADPTPSDDGVVPYKNVLQFIMSLGIHL